MAAPEDFLFAAFSNNHHKDKVILVKDGKVEVDGFEWNVTYAYVSKHVHRHVCIHVRCIVAQRWSALIETVLKSSAGSYLCVEPL